MTTTKLSVRAATTDEVRRIGFGHLLTKPGFVPELVRVVAYKHHIISHLLIERYTLRYGHVPLRTAGVGNVYTDPNHRRKGYAAAVMQDALALMVEQGAHLSLLHDTSGYFGRFGFTPVWPEYQLVFSSEQAAALPQLLKLRPPNPEDVPQIAHLYERHWAGRVTLNRNRETWIWRMTSEAQTHILVATDAENNVHGYISGNDLLSERIEVVADTPPAAVTLLSEVGRLHQSAGYDMVSWHIPPDDTIVAYARQILDIRLSVAYTMKGGWTARPIDTSALIETLLPEITAQAYAAYPSFDPAKLVIDCQPDVVKIGLSGKDKTFSELTYRDFMQVMFGSLDPHALTIRVRLTDEAVRLLRALFPSRMAVLGCWDWF